MKKYFKEAVLLYGVEAKAKGRPFLAFFEMQFL